MAGSLVQFEPQAQGVIIPATLVNLQGGAPQKSTATAILGRGDLALNQTNTLSVLLAGNRVRASGLGDNSTRSIASQDHADSLSGESLWGKADLTTVVSARSVNQMLISWSSDHRNTSPTSTAPEVAINGVGFLGGDSLGPHLYTSGQLQYGDTVSISRGGNLLDVGGGFTYDPAYEQQEPNLNGRFDYNSLAAYLANAPRRYQQTFATGDTRYQGSVRDLDLFVSSKLPLGKDVTLTGGLRWNGQDNPQPGHPNTAIVLTQRIPNDWKQWQPRFGVAWTPSPKTVVRVSSGIYSAPTPATIFHRISTDNGAQTVVADSYFDPQI